MSTAVAAWKRTFAILDDGTVWAWGEITGGRGWGEDPVTGLLGIGDAPDQAVPRRVEGLPAIRSIVVAGLSTFAVARDGSVWCWGSNNQGQLGIGTFDDQGTPVRIPGLTNVSSIVADYTSLFAVATLGSVWAWGENWHGKLGDGTTTDRSSPVQVRGLAGVTSLHVGGSTLVAVATAPLSITSSGTSDSDGQASDGRTDIVRAAAVGLIDRVQRLLELGTEPESVGPDGNPALIHAARSGHTPVVNFLLQAGADPNQPGRYGLALTVAANGGHVEVVRALTENGAHVDGQFNGVTAHMLASQKGDDALVRTLCELGADVDASDDQGHPALYYAAEAERATSVNLLLDLGANPDGVTMTESTPIEVAALKLNTEIVLVLLRAGAAPARMYRRMRALAFSSNGSAFAIPEWAVPQVLRRSDLWVGDFSSVPLAYWDRTRLTNGQTPLMFWATNGIVDEVRALVDAGTDIAETDRDGDDAQSYTMSGQHLEVLELLLKHGANPDARSSLLGQPSRVLHVAAATGWVAGVQTLLAHGATVNATEAAGITPIMLASGAGNDDCVTLLYDAGADPHLVDDDGDAAVFLRRVQRSFRHCSTVATVAA